MNKSRQSLTRTITLTNGMETIVDADLYEELNQYRWGYLTAGGYVVRAVRKPDGKRTTLFMHKVIRPSPKGMVTDHANGNPLDNRRENLRVCTHAQNLSNRRLKRGSSVQWKGVLRPYGKYWKAYINKTHLGHYPTAEAAARAYDRAAFERYGEFAKLNFPDEDPTKHPAPVCTLHRWAGAPKCRRCGEPCPPHYKPRKNRNAGVKQVG